MKFIEKRNNQYEGGNREMVDSQKVVLLCEGTVSLNIVFFLHTWLVIESGHLSQN